MKGVVTIKRRILIPFLTICTLLMFSMSAYAATPVLPKTNFDYKGTEIPPSVSTTYRTDHALFKDEAELLTPTSEKELWEKLEATVDYLNINIAVFIGGNYRTNDETVTFTDQAISSVFGKNSDTIFIYLDFEGYSPAYDYIRVSNKAEDIFPETKRNKILNVMYQTLPKSTEPIYEDAVRSAISKGLDEIKSQGYVNTARPSQTSTVRSYRTPEPVPQQKTDSGFMDFIRSIPRPYIYGGIAVIIVLILIAILSSAAKRRSRRTNNYYNNYNDNYYDHRDNYYSGRSYHHHSQYNAYNRRPPRGRPPRDYDPPPRNSRPPRSSPPPSGSSNNNNNSSHSSGSGHYR